MGKQFSRRDFLQIGTVTLGAVALSDFAVLTSVFAADTGKSKVFFNSGYKHQWIAEYLFQNR